ncbi:hypothetical protein A2631_01280 [Candidatus Daviesbacteria bacterium RIFCSPHIGHO2_01_FULL_44_29]|uniref:Glycoside hydrolase family 42 N-terminal domain-containing protein n=1 Tax=Candidatus Daviesbacteria bacterium RIFCSPHIGHO2_02_FULL_43_12 TaxID=1797776 RepID=A0A1F5KKY1_9BACT|nr:MAG: hypothetical protein A2631_01280 [Candidatus Daviesbacteria bacterium RIFCSPHIGHO2_01_FULL_44_29]OGE38905.1 MAG: hypothetical protein A3E86_04090 [Candidatus Daviesbacteria bacterium RIFCSPHIGHO2_12_FULL_47_45]OGE41524.1 MAG: hypothetical protein A3D25_00700 [Candidatus Daviesbacteria bacterium RIFCSPHIGHO2_02_FULL_43_12]OGE69806.1 MAG: hypothetical protein A3B55_05345 [Candidatus Daviesbacteria bacterium RIFCSPLOWO2_01_FULL_43_15]
MSHLPFTLLAYLLNSIAVLIDKFLLNEKIPDPLVYVFYFSVFSLIGLFIIPFTQTPDIQVFLLASSSTLLWTTGAYFMFKALQKGLVYRVIPVIGTLIPIFLLIFYGYISQSISVNQAWAAGILILGLSTLTLPYLKGRLILAEFGLELGSAFLFACSYIVLHWAYSLAPFLTVFAWSRLILIPVGMLIYLIPKLHQRVFVGQTQSFNLFSKMGWLFVFGQACGGSAELLLTFSIALANPALVNSLQGTQYIFLFLSSLILARFYPKIYAEKSTLVKFMTKVLGIVLIGIGLLILGLAQVKSPLADFGLTYSPRYAQSLGLDAKTTFTQSLQDLKIKKVRLPVYWDEVEPTDGAFYFKDIDFYLEEAAKYRVEVLLVVGYKQPRWPECFIPPWLSKLPIERQIERVLSLLLGEISHFKEFKAISMWQVENEPLLSFGSCSIPPIERGKLLEKELSLIKQLDHRPIMLTDSGELSSWKGVMNILTQDPDQNREHILGITMYRQVWNPLFGQVSYPLPPLFYDLKAKVMKHLTQATFKETLVAELQAEPWPASRVPIQEIPIEEQLKFFPLSQLKANISFARETNFKTAYLWGAEWWYFMALHGHPEYLEYIKSSINH